MLSRLVQWGVLLALQVLFHEASADTAIGKVNHYSDYGVVEQSDINHNELVNIKDNPFGYSDEYTDNESGLQYLQVRYYDPKIMRFTQMDSYPLLNRYAYADENPIMNDDPSGHSAVGASQNSGSAYTGVGGSGSIGSLIGLIGGTGLAFVGLVTPGAWIGLTLINTTTSIAGFISLFPLNNQVKEGLSIYSLVAGTIAAVTDIGIAASTYYRPIKTLDVAKLLSGGGLDSVPDDISYQAGTRGVRAIKDNNCVYRAMADQDFLTRPSDGGYVPRGRDDYYKQLETVVHANVTYPRWVSANDYESTIRSLAGPVPQGRKKVFGVLLEWRYAKSVQQHLITLVVGDGDNMFFLESNSRSQRDLATVFKSLSWPSDRSIRMSLYEVGTVNETKLTGFLRSK